MAAKRRGKPPAGDVTPDVPPASPPPQAPRWLVRFPWSPALVIEAATEADAWASYMRRCNLLATPHAPTITRLPDDQGRADLPA